MRPDKKKKPYKGKGKESQPSTQAVPQKEKAKPSDAPAVCIQAESAAKQSSAPDIKAIPSASSSSCDKVLVQDSDGVEANEPLATANKTFAYSKRKVFSNWERYTEPERIVDLDYEEHQGLDFEKLLQAPITAEGHFVFKSEKLEPPPSGNLFSLDLKTLSDGLRTIPFYKQLELSKSLFSVAEIEAMDRQAASYSVPNTERLLSQEPAPIVASSQPVLPVQLKSCPIVPSVQLSLSVKQASQVVPPPADNTPSPSTKPKTLKETATTNPCKETTAPDNISLPSEAVDSQEEIKAGKPDLVKPSKPETANPPETVASPVLKASNEDSLGSLLDDVDVCADIQPKSVQPSLAASTKDPKVNDDLEAWLDSVLDD